MKRMRSNDVVVYRPKKRQKRSKILYTEEEFERELEKRVKEKLEEITKFETNDFEGYDYIS